MANRSHATADERPEPVPSGRHTHAAHPVGSAHPAGLADTAWQTPGYTVVETALEVTAYSHATRR